MVSKVSRLDLEKKRQQILRNKKKFMKRRNNNDVKFKNKHRSSVGTRLNNKSFNEKHRMKIKHSFFKKWAYSDKVFHERI